MTTPPAAPLPPAIPALHDRYANEDWAPSRSWDIRLPDGTPTATIEATAAALGTNDLVRLAHDIFDQPFGRAAPLTVKAGAYRVLRGLPPALPGAGAAPPPGDDDGPVSGSQDERPEDERPEGKARPVLRLGRLGSPGAPGFDESAHPRDRAGRFIEVGAQVEILGGGRGTVTGVGRAGRISVRLTDGTLVERHRNYLTVTDDPPEAPPAPPTAGPTLTLRRQPVPGAPVGTPEAPSDPPPPAEIVEMEGTPPEGTITRGMVVGDGLTNRNREFVERLIDGRVTAAEIVDLLDGDGGRYWADRDTHNLEDAAESYAYGEESLARWRENDMWEPVEDPDYLDAPLGTIALVMVAEDPGTALAQQNVFDDYGVFPPDTRMDLRTLYYSADSGATWRRLDARGLHVYNGPAPEDGVQSGADPAQDTGAPDLTRGADLRAGHRLDLGPRGQVTVLRTRAGRGRSKDVVTARVRHANGTEFDVTVGRETILDLPDPPETVPVTDTPTGVALTRPVLATYQRRNINALHLDALDSEVSSQVRQAAARIRARKPLTASQSAALAEVLRRQGDADGVPAMRYRSLRRTAAALDAAAGRAYGLPEPATDNPLRAIAKTTVSDVGAGDFAAFANPDGTTVHGYVVAAEPIMRGRLVNVTLAEADGTRRTRLLDPRADAYLLPEPVSPNPVRPEGAGPEHVSAADVRVGDTIRGGGSGTFAAYEVLAEAEEVGPGDITRIRVLSALTGEEDDFRVAGDGPAVVRLARGPASQDQPWETFLPAENERTKITVDKARIGDRVEVDYGGGGLHQGYITQSRATAANSVQVLSDTGISLTVGRDHPLVRLAKSSPDAMVHIAAAEHARRSAGTAEHLAPYLDKEIVAYSLRLANAVSPPMIAGTYQPYSAEIVAEKLDRIEALDSGDNTAVNPLTRGMLMSVLSGGNIERMTSTAPAIDALIGDMHARLRTAFRASLAEAVPQDGESRDEAVMRAALMHMVTPPTFIDTRAVAAALVDLRLDLTTAELRTPPAKARRARAEQIADDAALPERIRGYRAQLPADLAQLGKTVRPTATFEPMTVADLEAGTPPTVRIVEIPVEDLAADGGPSTGALRQLAAIRAAGAEVDVEVERRVRANLGGLTPNEHANAARNLVEIRRHAIFDFWTVKHAALDDARNRLAPALLAKSGLDISELWPDGDFSPMALGNARRQTAGAVKAKWTRTMTAIDAAVEADPAVIAVRAQDKALSVARDEAAVASSRAHREAAAARRDATVAAIAELRPVGGIQLDFPEGASRIDDDVATILWGEDIHDELVAAMREAERLYPSAWLAAVQSGGPIGLGPQRRGYYNHASRQLRLSKDSSDPLGQYSSVAVHELGHAMEVTVPGLLAAESLFLYDRTATGAVGSRTRPAPRPLAELPGMGSYRAEEIAWEDEFRNAYTGKSYGGSAYEVFTTGIESQMAGTNFLDEDMRHWLLGVLALL